jgi:hypothetical protein
LYTVAVADAADMEVEAAEVATTEAERELAEGEDVDAATKEATAAEAEESKDDEAALSSQNVILRSALFSSH